MNRLKINLLLGLMAFSQGLLSSGIGLAQQEIEGVFGVESGGELSAIAFWVPLEGGESIEGVRWFNNDGAVVFPEILAVAGNPNQPELMADAVVVASGVSGATLGVSELIFDQPLASNAEGLYLIWRMPVGVEFQGAGEGPGFGCLAGETENCCWLSGDGAIWEPFTVNHQMAMAVVMNTNKSGGVLVLNRPGSASQDPAPEIARELPANLAITLEVAPNPFNPSTEIRFNLPRSGSTEVAVYDVKGSLIRQIWNGHLVEGFHDLSWNGKTDRGEGAPSGVYLLRVSGSGLSTSRPITLLK
jgi:hypothetical protein